MEKELQGNQTPKEIKTVAKWMNRLGSFLLVLSVVLFFLHVFGCSWWMTSRCSPFLVYPFCVLTRISPLTYAFGFFKSPDAYGAFLGCLLLVPASFIVGLLMRTCSRNLIRGKRWAWFLSVILMAISLLPFFYLVRKSLFSIFGQIVIPPIDYLFVLVFNLVVLIFHVWFLVLLFHKYKNFPKVITIILLYIGLMIYLIGTI